MKFSQEDFYFYLPPFLLPLFIWPWANSLSISLTRFYHEHYLPIASLLSNLKPLSPLLSADISGICAPLLQLILLLFISSSTHQNQLPCRQISRIFLPPSPPPQSRIHQGISYSTHIFIPSPNITSSQWSLTAKRSHSFCTRGNKSSCSLKKYKSVLIEFSIPKTTWPLQLTSDSEWLYTVAHMWHT